MEIITDGLFVDTVSWIATANEAMMINENIYSKKLIKMTNKKTCSQNNLIDKSQSPMEVIQVILASDRGAIRIKQIGRS